MVICFTCCVAQYVYMCLPVGAHLCGAQLHPMAKEALSLLKNYTQHNVNPDFFMRLLVSCLCYIDGHRNCCSESFAVLCSLCIRLLNIRAVLSIETYGPSRYDFGS